MGRDLEQPITCLITSGSSDALTTPTSSEFRRIITLVDAAASAGVTFVQLREKRLSTRMLFELARSCVATIGDRSTRLLVNDRADLAFAASAAGVHLTTRSIPARAIRRSFGDRFLIGVSTHSLEEVRVARDGLADYATFGPVFQTSSKQRYGPPVGLESLDVSTSLDPDFPIIALGGINVEFARKCFEFGAVGIAGIGMFSDPNSLADTVNLIHSAFSSSASKRQ